MNIKNFEMKYCWSCGFYDNMGVCRGIECPYYQEYRNMNGVEEDINYDWDNIPF